MIQFFFFWPRHMVCGILVPLQWKGRVLSSVLPGKSCFNFLNQPFWNIIYIYKILTWSVLFIGFWNIYTPVWPPPQLIYRIFSSPLKFPSWTFACLMFYNTFQCWFISCLYVYWLSLFLSSPLYLLPENTQCFSVMFIAVSETHSRCSKFFFERINELYWEMILFKRRECLY